MEGVDPTPTCRCDWQNTERGMHARAASGVRNEANFADRRAHRRGDRRLDVKVLRRHPQAPSGRVTRSDLERSLVTRLPACDELELRRIDQLLSAMERVRAD